MDLKYVFDVGKHTNLCLTESKGVVKRRLEILYSPTTTTRRLGWDYLGSWPGTVTLLIDPDLEADDAVDRLRKLHAEIRDRGICKHRFKLATNSSWSREPNGRPSGKQKLEYDQWYMSTPVAKLSMNFRNNVRVDHAQVCRAEFRPDQFLHRPVLQTYQALAMIDPRMSNTKALRHLRRFVRHVERFGLEEYDPNPLH